MGDPMAFRAAEAEARPGAVAAAQGMLDMWRKAANLWPTQRPWMNATDIKGLLDAVRLTQRPWEECIQYTGLAQCIVQCLQSPHQPRLYVLYWEVLLLSCSPALERSNL
jgi:hypothetical protein